MSLSYTQRLELTIFGYVRENYKDEIPDDITRICLEYYNKIEIIWDTFCNNIADIVSDDGFADKSFGSMRQIFNRYSYIYN